MEHSHQGKRSQKQPAMQLVGLDHAQMLERRDFFQTTAEDVERICAVAASVQKHASTEAVHNEAEFPRKAWGASCV